MEQQVENKENQIEQTFYVIGWIGLSVVGIFFLLWKCTGFSLASYLPPCVFRLVTGLNCPGCGGTRAVVSFFQGHFLESFLYHPIVLYTGVVYGWFMISRTIELCSRGRFRIGLKFRPMYLWIALGIILINCLIKNIVLVKFGIDLLI